ncbi:hypothetical protein MAPG_00193 [Magnaporthiopsis poae ATCC 64411]|uniref:Heterokaryon incompatibility domain-containing protein n=1 Tax=Magnaporthiopsis poae (strain ATCC 64411 / 73-15) TaxID=644358 RepID=A0A0C4DKC5_MAGP6|nr:hypothetical protein MAPG_00193 [Magnaporthiopsis poae ATCC 64411]
MDLCLWCQSFSLYKLASLPQRTGTFQLTRVRQGVRARCRFCCLLLSSVCTSQQQHNESEERMRIYIQAISSRDSEGGGHQGEDTGRLLHIDGLRVFLAPLAYLADGLKPVEGSLATLNVCADRGSVAAKTGAVSGRYLGHNPLSTNFVHEVQDWLDACSRGHERCRRSLSGGELPGAMHSPLPTRCIEVGSEGDEALRLVDTAGKVGAYATLSHRWGAQTGLSQTTALNYEARKVGFSASELPKTFRDAVAVARRLGVRYLWIDSLCIIQGEGSDDWACEAGRMAGYYQGSLVTLAAASRTQEHDGLFRSDRTSSQQFARNLTRLVFRDHTGSPRGEFYVFPAEPVAPLYESEIRSSALMSRGWVFQECLFSRRIVYFAGPGAYLECQIDSPQNSYGEHLTTWQDEQPVLSDFPRKTFVDFSTATREPGRIWRDIVEAYSALELSCPDKDRLFALSGVLAEFSLARKARYAVSDHDLYASGLWLSDLHRGLLWQQKHRPLPGVDDAKIANMPSWSWASFPGPATWEMFRRPQEVNNVCEIPEMGTADGNTFTVGPDDVRAYAEAEAFITRICLRSRALPVTAWEEYTPLELSDLPVPVPAPLGGSHNAPFRKLSLAPTPADGGSNSNSNTRHVCGWASFEAAGFQDQRGFADGSKETLALHVLTSRASHGWMERGLFLGWKPAHCVILMRRADNSEDREPEYRRIGVGALWGARATAALNKADMRDVWLV